MRIDIVGRDTWRDLSEEWRRLLPFQDPAVHVQVYGGYQHAITEATQGIAKLFSHKKSIAIVEPADPAMAQLAVTFSEDTYKVHRWTFGNIGEVDATDTLFVLSAEDDPVTGRLYDHGPLQAAIKDQRVFRIRVSHAGHRGPLTTTRPGPFEVRILSLSPDLALLIAGERFRVRPMIAPQLTWNLSSATRGGVLVTTSPTQYEENKNRILAFESQLPTGFRRYFGESEARLFDRAVIVAEECDGSAVIENLADLLKIELHRAGLENVLEATSPCRWNHPRFTDWLLSRGESEEVVRGMIVIDPSLLDENFAAVLKSAKP